MRDGDAAKGFCLGVLIEGLPYLYFWWAIQHRKTSWLYQNQDFREVDVESVVGAFEDTGVKALAETVVEAFVEIVVEAFWETAADVGEETLERILISSFELTTTTVYTPAEDCEEDIEETAAAVKTAAEVLEAVIVELFLESFESSFESFEAPVGMAVELRV